MQNSKNQKIFLIINLSCFGDVLLTNTLCQNIKLNYPESKVVLLVDKPFYEAAKYQYCVDDAIYFDKRGKDKGFSGMINFSKSCKYKNKIYAAFIMYDNDRGIILSYLLRAQKRISGPNKIFKWMLTDIHFERKNELVHMQDIIVADQIGQFVMSLTLDSIGAFGLIPKPISLEKIIGLIVIIIGVCIFFYKDLLKA